MTTAIDSDVILALWDAQTALNLAARSALEAAFNRGKLVAAAPVFAELVAASGHGEGFVTSFFDKTGIVVDWELGEPVWRAAAQAFQAYAKGRVKQSQGRTRLGLADFVIGAHAAENHCRLLTLDDSVYRAAFPGLAIETF